MRPRQSGRPRSPSFEAAASRLSKQMAGRRRGGGIPVNESRFADPLSSWNRPSRPCHDGAFSHMVSAVLDAAAGQGAPQKSASSGRSKATVCAKCGTELSTKEVNYCRFNFAKLGRRYLCRKCQ